MILTEKQLNDIEIELAGGSADPHLIFLLLDYIRKLSAEVGSSGVTWVRANSATDMLGVQSKNLVMTAHKHNSMEQWIMGVQEYIGQDDYIHNCWVLDPNSLKDTVPPYEPEDDEGEPL
jgi:hypothetical protein